MSPAPTNPHARISALERQVAYQGELIAALASALLKHARTDLAPDAALPELRTLAAAANKRARAGKRGGA